MREMTFSVKLRVPDEATVAEVREYIRDAVETWGGQRHPDDVLFPSNIRKVSIVCQRVIHKPVRHEPFVPRGGFDAD